MWLLFLSLQFFLIIMAIFAAEVAALVFGFIYQGKVSYRWRALCLQCLLLTINYIWGIKLYYMSVFFFSQISGNLEHSMSEVFSLYGQEETDTKAVDYLQTQVGVVWCINNFIFALLISLLFTASALFAFPLFACFHFPLLCYQKQSPFTLSSSLVLKKSSLEKRKNPLCILFAIPV